MIEISSFKCSCFDFNELSVSAVKIAAVGTASAVGAYVGGPVVLGAVGFTKMGVAAGSIAAALQV